MLLWEIARVSLKTKISCFAKYEPVTMASEIDAVDFLLIWHYLLV